MGAAGRDLIWLDMGFQEKHLLFEYGFLIIITRYRGNILLWSRSRSFCDKRRGNVTEWLWGRDNVIDCGKIKFRVIVPKNGTVVPFFKRFWKIFSPRRYQRGYFLFDTLLDTFLVKEKYPQGGCVSPQRNFWFLQAIVWSRSQNIIFTLWFKLKFQQDFSFVELRAPHRAYFLM